MTISYFTFQDYIEKKVKSKSRMNVGIFSDQRSEIKKLVGQGKYRSINHFVITAVQEKLEKEKIK